MRRKLDVNGAVREVEASDDMPLLWSCVICSR
jgi:hypothetical protein